MELFTYYDFVPEHNHENELRMLNLWIRHHRALGFDPFVLQPFHARKHPYFEEIHNACAKLPSINPHGYDVACYDRWIAMSVVAGGRGVMMDYDTFLYPKIWDDLSFLIHVAAPELVKLSVFQRYVPCMVMGTSKTFLQWAWIFAKFEPAEGLKHTSDQNILEHWAIRQPQSYNQVDLVKCYGEPGWQDAIAVHYSNASMTPAEKTPRWKHIPVLRPLTLPEA